MLLKSLREDRDLHQKDVASYLGVSRSAYSNYENGSREPGIEILKKLADFFRVSMDELLGYTPKKRGGAFPGAGREGLGEEVPRSLGFREEEDAPPGGV